MLPVFKLAHLALIKLVSESSGDSLNVSQAHFNMLVGYVQFNSVSVLEESLF